MPDADFPAPLPPGQTFLGHLANLPAMFGAISRLIGKGAAVGEAWLDIPLAEGERRAQAIRDDKAAHTAFVKIIQDAAGPEAVKDPELLKRAIASWGGERLRKQANKEGVARKAAEVAEQTPMPEDATPPSDDWMNVFESHAEKASSDEMRSLWGRVLNGEVRKSGAFSLRGLAFLSTLDAAIVNSVELFAPYLIFEGVVPNLPSLNNSPIYTSTMMLISSNLVVPQASYFMDVSSEGDVLIPLGKHRVIRYTATERNRVSFPGYVLTSLGLEVFMLAAGDRDIELRDELNIYLKGILGDIYSIEDGHSPLDRAKGKDGCAPVL